MMYNVPKNYQTLTRKLPHLSLRGECFECDSHYNVHIVILKQKVNEHIRMMSSMSNTCHVLVYQT